MYQQLRAVVEDDFQAVNQYVIDQLYSEVELVESIGHYIVEAGGKRMRPVLVGMRIAGHLQALALGHAVVIRSPCPNL